MCLYLVLCLMVGAVLQQLVSCLGLEALTVEACCVEDIILTDLDSKYFFSSNYFCCPWSLTFLLLEGYIMGLKGDFFPSWDSNLSSLVLMGVFLIHLAVQVQAISCTPLSPGWAPAVNLVLWYHCWITTWESDPPE